LATLKTGEEVHSKCFQILHEAIRDKRLKENQLKYEIKGKMDRIETQRCQLRGDIYSLEWKSNPDHFLNFFRSREAITRSQKEREECQARLEMLNTEFVELQLQIDNLPSAELRADEEKYKHIQDNIVHLSTNEHYFEFQKQFKRNNKYVSERYKLSIDPDSVWGHLRQEAFNRYGRLCSKCLSEENLQVHHVIPLSLGGTNDISNLEILCEACHESKHGRIFNYDGDDDLDEYGEDVKVRSQKAADISIAIQMHKEISIKYVNREGVERERIVKPEEIFTNRGRIYFVGYCHFRGEQRTFRVSRIKRLTIIN